MNKPLVPTAQPGSHLNTVWFKLSCTETYYKEYYIFVAELQDNINRLDEEAGNIYNEEQLQQHPYKLHAVLVHEGQAASGKDCQ